MTNVVTRAERLPNAVSELGAVVVLYLPGSELCPLSDRASLLARGIYCPSDSFTGLVFLGFLPHTKNTTVLKIFYIHSIDP